MLVCMSANVFAIGESDIGTDSKVLYISSESAPNDADEFARDQFTHFNAGTFAAMGFSADEAADMRLAPAFKALPYDDSITLADNIYHYPVITNNKIVGILKVTYYDNKYNYQLEFSEFAQLLNDLTASDKSPAIIVLSHNAYFAVTDSDVDVLQTFSHTDASAIPGESVSVRSITEQASARSINVVEIGNDTVFAEKVKTAATRQPINYLLPVPVVYNEYNGQYKNVCWAATIGSLADFTRNGSWGQNNAMACYYRDSMVTEHYNETGNYTCLDNEITNYTSAYVGYNVTFIASKLNWQELSNELVINNRPFLIKLRPLGDNYSHMTLLCGAEYENTDPYNQNYWNICMMDPNSGYVVMGYNSFYNNGGYIAYWYGTFIHA